MFSLKIDGEIVFTIKLTEMEETERKFKEKWAKRDPGPALEVSNNKWYKSDLLFSQKFTVANVQWYQFC